MTVTWYDCQQVNLQSRSWEESQSEPGEEAQAEETLQIPLKVSMPSWVILVYIFGLQGEIQ